MARLSRRGREGQAEQGVSHPNRGANPNHSNLWLLNQLLKITALGPVLPIMTTDLH
jgi:hypothetical protein